MAGLGGQASRLGLLGRVGTTGARHPFVFLGAWLVLLVAIFATALLGLGGQALFGRLSSSAPSVRGESYYGGQVLTPSTKSTTYSLLVHGVDLGSSKLQAIAAGLTSKTAD